MKVLVTGANGFVGRPLVTLLKAQGMDVVPCVRKAADAGQFAIGNIDGETDWRDALAGCDGVVHLAARVHVMQEKDGDAGAAYQRDNVDATMVLARQASQAGVRRFVFVSSIKVNGESSRHPFRHDDTPAPRDPYGQSKLDAERSLQAFASQSGMEVVIVRPVLVYGPGVKANFAQLMRMVQRCLPLPFGAVHNARSLLAIDNLVDLLALCLRHPDAAGQVFLAADGRDFSTGALVRTLAAGMGRRAFLLPVPCACLRMLAALAGRQAQAERVLGNLQADISHAQQWLGWHPPVDAATALAACARSFVNHGRTE